MSQSILLRMQERILRRRIESYAKTTGMMQPEKIIWRSYSLDSLENYDCLPQMPLPYSYPSESLTVFDVMVLNKLQLLQFAVPDHKSRFLVIDLPDAGLGASMLHVLSNAYMYSYLYNRALLVDDSRLVYDFCYQPLSSHCLQDIRARYSATGRAEVAFNFLPQKEKLTYLNRRRFLGLRPIPHIFNPVHPLYLPIPNLYTRGLVLGGVLKLKQEYKAHIEEKMSRIGVNPPIIGVHIRQGDVISDPSVRFRVVPLDIYLNVVKKIAEKTGIKTVFVTTDSQQVIRDLPKNSGLDFIYDDTEKRYDNCNAQMLQDSPELKRQETMTAISNIHILSRCDYIIGGISSWFYNSLALSYFRNKKMNGIRIIRGNKADEYAINYYIADPVSPRR